jgi:Flp pilus assembly protein TadD
VFAPLFLQPAPLSCKLATVFLQADDEARSLELRQQGNAAFKQGELHQALAWYWQAITLNPGDTAVLNNISLACLKQGDVQQVWLAAVFARMTKHE